MRRSGENSVSWHQREVDKRDETFTIGFYNAQVYFSIRN